MNNRQNEIISLPAASSRPEVKPTIRASVVNALKKARASQPFNFLATSVVHACQQVTGVRSEFVIKHLHRVGSVRRTLPNGQDLLLWSRADDWVSNQIYWRGWDGYEPETVPLFFRLATQARVTFDVGAYVGFFSLLAAHANPNGRVFAFEPLPSVHQRLLHNIELNRLTNVQCVASAVGETDGAAEFWHMDAETPCSSSLSFEFMRTAENLVSSIVPVITLDRFVQDNNLNRVDLMKLDTESTEYQVLCGMTETLRRDHPIIISEVLLGRGGEAPLEEVLRRFGYRFYHLTPEGPIHRDKIEGHPEWLNYLLQRLAQMKSPDSSVKESDSICLACDSKRHRLVGSKNQFDLWKCECCGTIFTRTQIKDEVLEDLYDHYYDAAHFETPSVVAQSLERVVLSFERFRLTGRILDIGYGEGGLLQLAGKHAWQCFGTEISPQALEHGKNQGWIVTNNAEDDPRFIPQGFDVVTMIELLEHVPTPQQVLQSAARWLRPGGLLYLTTPNAKSLNQRLLGLEWSIFCPPEHIAIWTPKGLRHILSKSGFQHLRIRTEGLNPYEILAHWRSQKEAVNRNQTGMALNTAFSTSPYRRTLKTGINHVLSVLQIGDGLKVYATRNH